MITGGSILNGRMSGPESTVTTTLNGPSCSGQIVGDVQRRDVVVGDIVIIPAGVPHGRTTLRGHVAFAGIATADKIATEFPPTREVWGCGVAQRQASAQILVAVHKPIAIGGDNGPPRIYCRWG